MNNNCNLWFHCYDVDGQELRERSTVRPLSLELLALPSRKLVVIRIGSNVGAVVPSGLA